MNQKPISPFQLKLIKLFGGAFTRWSAGRYKNTNGSSMSKFGGKDVCVVTMTGAKSGKPRSVPLMHVPYGEGVILVASMLGAEEHPSWYHNLVANPDIDVQVKGQVHKLRARRASTEEKTAVWPTCVEYWPDYEKYQDRTDRDIPVFICEPR